MKNKTAKNKGQSSNTVKWIVSVFFILSALAFFPSFASIFMLLTGAWFLPIKPLEQLKNKYIPQKKWLKSIVATLLIILCIATAPTSPADPAEDVSAGEETVVEATEVNEEDAPPVLETVEDASAVEDTESISEAAEAGAIHVVEEETLPAELPDGSTFNIHFIDVGQADATLVECDGHFMLIDGGNKEDSNVIFSVLKKAAVPTLDIVVGTHAHEDHIGGLPGAFNYTNADLTLCPVTNYDSDAFVAFAEYADAKGGGITVPSVGDIYNLGSASVEILGVNGGSDANDTSIVLMIKYGDTSFLFTGDAERDAEQAILSSGADLSATVLKVGHHGSDTSTTYPFLREIMPEYAVISVGSGNSYGHPTEDALSRLRDADVTVFRTDLQGDVFCTSDGKTVTFSTSRNADVDVFDNIGENSTQKPNEQTDTIVTDTPNNKEDSPPIDAETSTPAPAPTPEPEPEPTPEPEAPAPEPEAPPSEMVWVSGTGKRYHNNPNCSGMNSPTQVTIETAQGRGLTPCKNCY